MITKSDLYGGLTANEALERLTRLGLNELPSAQPRKLRAIALDTVREPMFILLLACSILYLGLGDLGEALLLSSAIFVVVLITFIQEQRTERTLDALRDLSSPRALVVRDGVATRIAGKFVVPGDLVLIAEGDRIPADGFVTQSKALKLDESLLSGESVPVEKCEWNGVDPITQAGGDDTPFVYSGTLVVQGSGAFLVHATGASTAMGRIGASLAATVRPNSGLQTETKRVVRVVALSSLTLSVGIAVIWWLRAGEILRGVLMGLTFAMSTIPEEFPVVLTVFMALGAWRISRRRVLTRQMHAIETLGSATYLCVDKTGTLTENRMRVAAVWTFAEGVVPLHPDQMQQLLRSKPELRELAQVAGHASEPEGSDPMDIASRELALHVSPAAKASEHCLRTYPLVRPLLAVGYAWSSPAPASTTIAIKGAPEAVATLVSLPPRQHEEFEKAVQLLAQQGYRVLAVAQSQPLHGELPASIEDLPCRFLGLLAYSDPVRAGVAAAVERCHQAGIKVMMITGDYPATALSVAQQIGLEGDGSVLSGSELMNLDAAQLGQRLLQVRVLARMVPEHKLRVVHALRARGEIVAMTGDGVNDAPALKAAHIGIAMGKRGTDVAREAAALVLLDDDFTSIVSAIALGRRIYDNIQKAIAYIIAIHVPIVGLTLIPLLMDLPLILWPVHLAFLELIIDPVCSIAFEAEPAEATIMQRPPRPSRARLFSKAILSRGLLEGLCVLIAVISVYLTLGRSQAEDHARAVAFATLIWGNIALILTLRSRTEPAWQALRRPNPTLLWIGLALLAMGGLVLYMPRVVDLFHFAPPHASDLALSALIAAVSVIGFEVLKVWRRSQPKAAT